MKTPIKLKLWIVDFVKKHFNDVDWNDCDYGDKTFDEIMEEINEKPDIMVGWILTEVMSWSMKDDEDWNRKLNILIDNEDDDYIIKIDDHFYMRDISDHFLMKEVFPKYKQVLYFSDEKD